MAAAEKIGSTANAEEINNSANLALTNITAAQVVWRRGGIGISLWPETPRECWAGWWKQAAESFRANAVPKSDRNNGPNYGIYKMKEGLTIRQVK